MYFELQTKTRSKTRGKRSKRLRWELETILLYLLITCLNISVASEAIESNLYTNYWNSSLDAFDADMTFKTHFVFQKQKSRSQSFGLSCLTIELLKLHFSTFDCFFLVTRS